MQQQQMHTPGMAIPLASAGARQQQAATLAASAEQAAAAAAAASPWAAATAHAAAMAAVQARYGSHPQQQYNVAHSLQNIMAVPQMAGSFGVAGMQGTPVRGAWEGLACMGVMGGTSSSKNELQQPWPASSWQSSAWVCMAQFALLLPILLSIVLPHGWLPCSPHPLSLLQTQGGSFAPLLSPPSRSFHTQLRYADFSSSLLQQQQMASMDNMHGVMPLLQVGKAGWSPPEGLLPMCC